DDLNKIEEILENYKAHGIKGVKSVKTSKSGSVKNIVLVIYFPCLMTLKDTHALCDKIEFDLEHKLKNTNVVIHPEPDSSCVNKENCKLAQNSYTGFIASFFLSYNLSMVCPLISPPISIITDV